MMKIQLVIRANEGYTPSQVRGVTVEELKSWLEDLDDNDEIVTCDENNPRGANYGAICHLEECENEDDE